MAVTITLVVSAEEFAFGRLMAEHPDTSIRIERIVPLGAVISPFIWVSGVDSDAVCESLLSDPDVVDTERLATTNDETLYRIEFREGLGGLVESLVATEATILEATGRSGKWQFVLRFRDHERASEFRRQAADRGVSLDVRSIYDPGGPPTEGSNATLTAAQREALLTAYDAGYFEVPRRDSLRNLAQELGISDSALSQRLRRGIERLVEENIVELRPG
ncbi:helix-turn-helix domain-containing protein [Halobium palmae]|uniref:Helix-turn-helix domain-containing protein n=1 Tax=Halobium palmae TaxID=1776492 RepID=A0ABD5RWB7_9EURY